MHLKIVASFFRQWILHAYSKSFMQLHSNESLGILFRLHIFQYVFNKRVTGKNMRLPNLFNHLSCPFYDAGTSATNNTSHFHWIPAGPENIHKELSTKQTIKCNVIGFNCQVWYSIYMSLHVNVWLFLKIYNTLANTIRLPRPKTVQRKLPQIVQIHSSNTAINWMIACGLVHNCLLCIFHNVNYIFEMCAIKRTKIHRFP